jgi:RNase adaptor protein for sRNA GlmZ degradation
MKYLTWAAAIVAVAIGCFGGSWRWHSITMMPDTTPIANGLHKRREIIAPIRTAASYLTTTTARRLAQKPRSTAGGAR